MQCSECGTKEVEIKEYDLSFKVALLNSDKFTANYSRNFCKDCIVANINLLKSELMFMFESDGIPTEKNKLNIFLDKEFEKT